MSSDEESANNDKVLLSDIEEDPAVIEIDDNLQENENPEEVQRDEGEENQEESKTVKPKRIIRNPQPKLNDERIKGPRGIAALESYFDRVKFKGKGHEEQDLNVTVKMYEYWCHRLFPKFPFDICIEKLEKLGTKKSVQTHVKRIRFDLIIEDTPIIDSSDEETNVDGFVNIDNDEITKQFDQLLETRAVPENQTELTEEQLERMRLNKERAEKIRQEKMRKNHENVDVSSQVPGTSGNGNELDFSQSTDNEMGSQKHQDSTFDLESNIKGKTNINGSTVKKRSKKQHMDEGAEESRNESTTFQNSHTFESESDQEMDEISRKSGSETNGVEKNSTFKKRRKTAHVLDSDESDTEGADPNEIQDFSNGSQSSKYSKSDLIGSENKENSSVDNIT